MIMNWTMLRFRGLSGFLCACWLAWFAAGCSQSHEVGGEPEAPAKYSGPSATDLQFGRRRVPPSEKFLSPRPTEPQAPRAASQEAARQRPATSQLQPQANPFAQAGSPATANSSAQSFPGQQ